MFPFGHKSNVKEDKHVSTECEDKKLLHEVLIYVSIFPRLPTAMENFKSGRGLFQNRHNFDGDLMSWRAGDQSTNRPMSRLESAWEKFGGFSNRYHRKSANAEQQQTESKENDI